MIRLLHTSILKDGQVLDDWWGFYPLGRHARVTVPVVLTGPNILLIKVVSRGNLLAPGTMYEKTSHETSLDLDNRSDHH